jgi:hypothetical protein
MVVIAYMLSRASCISEHDLVIGRILQSRHYLLPGNCQLSKVTQNGLRTALNSSSRTSLGKLAPPSRLWKGT